MGVNLYRDRASMPPMPLEDLGSDALMHWCGQFMTAQHEAERRGDYWQNCWGGWARAYDLARLLGWRPQGTHLPVPNWSGTYCSNDGAEVTATDAAAMADALERALALPLPVKHGHAMRLARAARENDGPDDALVDVANALSALTNRTDRERIVALVRFLRRGAFTIE